MTNEDAKCYIRTLLEIGGCDGFDYKQREALNIAIKALEQQPCEDVVSRKRVIILIDEASEIHPYKVVGDSNTYSNYNQGWSDACDWLYANIDGIPSVKPQYTDEEIDKAQVVEQAYVDKMVELAVEESWQKWLSSFDTSSATKCFEAVQLLKQRLEVQE